MAHIPALKFVSLAIKTLSKPVASEIKKQAVQHERMKEVLYALGQANHRLTSIVTIRAAGFQAVSIKPLDRATAVAKGGDLFGEIFIFSVGGVLLVWEYNNGLQKTAAKEEKQRAAKEAERAALQAQFDGIYKSLDSLESRMDYVNPQRRSKPPAASSSIPNNSGGDSRVGAAGSVPDKGNVGGDGVPRVSGATGTRASAAAGNSASSARLPTSSPPAPLQPDFGSSSDEQVGWFGDLKRWFSPSSSRSSVKDGKGKDDIR